MNKLLSSFKWGQILIYLIATLLFTSGLKQLSFLKDIDLVDNYVRQGQEFLNNDLENGAKRMSDFLIWTKLFEILGLMISGLIMWVLRTKSKYSWTNPLTVFLFGLIIIQFGLLNEQWIKKVIFFIGGQFSQVGLFYSYLINGLILTGLGLMIFYSTRTRTVN